MLSPQHQATKTKRTNVSIRLTQGAIIQSPAGNADFYDGRFAFVARLRVAIEHHKSALRKGTPFPF